MVDEHLRKNDPAKRGGDIATSLAKLSLSMSLTNTPPSPGLKTQQQQLEEKKGEENEEKSKPEEEKDEEKSSLNDKEQTEETKEKEGEEGEGGGDVPQQPFGKSKRKVVFLLPGGSNLKVAPTTPSNPQERQGEGEGTGEIWEETYKDLESLRLTTKQEKLFTFNKLLGESGGEGGQEGEGAGKQAPRTPLMAVPLSEVGFTPVWGAEQVEQLQFPPSLDMDFSFLEEDPLLRELGKQMK